jgi:integration host factor subunit beta
MTRSELVERLAQRMGQLTLRDAEQAVKSLFDAMTASMAKGHRIEIRGFGSFAVNHRRPRVGRNPRSGESVLVPEKRVAHFKPGKILRAAVEEIPPPILATELLSSTRTL